MQDELSISYLPKIQKLKLSEIGIVLFSSYVSMILDKKGLESFSHD